jgi:lipopolysaccharide transport system ATP-binding protein
MYQPVVGLLSPVLIMNDIAIKVEGLSKLYRIGSRQPGYQTLRESIVNATTSSIRRLTSLCRLGPSFRSPDSSSAGPQSSVSGPDNHIWALKDVSFEVKQGEVVGIIGRNGAGKSTLLKILSRITEPTKGYAEIRGRVGSLLEIGTGFHPELTGRENIYLNGAILGMNRFEIEKKFDEILAFAETEKFIDTPVKHYSSGMTVRLAFGVAAHLEPDILLIDEVLAVGDAAFQRKCLGKMGDVAKGGRTVVFVSHNMGAIRQLCDRVIWIDQGKIRDNGEVEEVVTNYLADSSRGFVQNNLESDNLRIERVILKDRNGRSKSSFLPGEDLVVEIHFFAKKFIPKPYFWVNLVSQYGSVLGANMLLDGHRPDSIEGNGMLICTLMSIPLLPQTYSVRMGVRGENGVTFLIKTAEVAFFNVQGIAKTMGWAGENADSLISSAAPVFIAYEWGLPDGQRILVEPKWD